MLFPFRVIESKISQRNEFDLTTGYQPTHSLFYLKRGSFDIEINNVKEKICEGDCVLLPDYIFFRRNVVNPIEFVYVKFTNNENCPYTFDIPYGKVTFRDSERFLSSIRAMEEMMARDDYMASAYREHLVMDILFQIYAERHEGHTPLGERPIQDSLVTSSIGYIREHLRAKLLIDEICHAVGSNPSTLNFKFRRELHISVGEFILNERMKTARHYLIGTTYTISEIASLSGFENVYYFSNAFKKVHGVSPSEYRRAYD